MVTLQDFLRVSLFALLLLDAHGLPVKGSQSQHQSSSSTKGGSVTSHQDAGEVHYPPVSHSTSGGVSKPVHVVKQHPGHPQYVQAGPVYGSLSSVPEVGYSVGSGSPVQAGYVGSAFVPVQAGYYQPGSFMPVSDASSQQTGAAQSSLPETQWAIPPKAFEEASTDTWPQDSSIVLPAPPAPALQSGETSNVVKEAELGSYHQQTEEFGYPAMGPGQDSPPVALPSLGVGGFWGYPSPYPLSYPFPYPWGYPYPDFDYRLLYGLYPPGTYTTFSKEHEKGKDYYQTTHYLKEHGSDAPATPQNPGTGQQKVFPASL